MGVSRNKEISLGLGSVPKSYYRNIPQLNTTKPASHASTALLAHSSPPNERLNIEDSFIKSWNGAPSPKGRLVNVQTTKAINK